MLRVLSLNAWAGQKRIALKRFLQECNADVICLQEVHDSVNLRPRSILDNWQQVLRPCLYEEIRDYLPCYRGSHHPFAYRWLNDGETTDLPIRYGIATFVHTRLHIIGQESRFVFGSYQDKDGTRPLPRNMHCIRVYDPETGHAYVIAHFHGLWQREGRMDTPERNEQAMNIVAMLRGFVHPGERLIVCGDMNVLPESKTLKMLVREFGLRELVTGMGFEGTRTNLVREKVKDPFADYLLVSSMVDVLTFDVPRRPIVSDHCPLLLECA